MKVTFNTDKIRKHLLALEVSGHSFAYDCGVSRPSWDSVMAGDCNPRLETACKIAAGMKCTIDELLIIEK